MKKNKKIFFLFVSIIFSNTSWSMHHSLNLSNTQITDADLQFLLQIPRFTALNLSNTQITDAGLQFLLQIPELTALNLSNTQITDAGLQFLLQIPELIALPFTIVQPNLDLSSNKIIDTGANDVPPMKGLNNP